MKEHVAVGSFPSSASPTNLLYVAFDALWHVDVNHTIKILEVEAHAKCDGSNYYPNLARSEVLQQLGLLFLFKTSMEHCCFESGIGEEIERLGR